jgi:hypothetical protein
MYYYIQDEDDAFMGLQSSRSGKIKAAFDTTAAIQNIKWFSEIEGEIIPIKEVNPTQYRLEGFQWRDEEKPKGKNDLQFDGRLRPYIDGTLQSNWDEDSLPIPVDSPPTKKEAMQFILQYLFLNFW